MPQACCGIGLHGEMAQGAECGVGHWFFPWVRWRRAFRRCSASACRCVLSFGKLHDGARLCLGPLWFVDECYDLRGKTQDKHCFLVIAWKLRRYLQGIPTELI